MNKVAVVIGVAAVATLAGCKDPDYARSGATASQNEVKSAATTPTAPAAAKPAPAKVQAIPTQDFTKCKCRPGTRHTRPCACGADNCMCVVEVKPVKVAEPTTTYIVQNGDFLAKISKRFNVSISSIKRLNHLKGDIVRVGQKLKLPGTIDLGVQSEPVVQKRPSKAAGKAAKKSYQAYTGATKEYVVKNGDTLGKIAYSNGINIRQLKELNKITSDQLKLGQKLKVPADKAAAAAANKAASKASAKTSAPEVAPAKETAPANAPAETAPSESAAPAAPAADANAAAPAADANAAAPAAPEAAPAPAPAKVETVDYVVQEGEDFTAIVVKFGVSPAEVRELNNLGEKDQLAPGQKIKLPAEVRQ